MTQLLADREERLPMASVGIASGSAGSKIAPQNLSEVVKFAEVMCRADIALPQHLRGNAGACMAVSLQALDWQMNPFAVASKSYAVGGRIAYEAQLIVAVVNTRSGIEGRIKYRFEGEGAERVCIAIGKLDGEELEVRSPKFKDITPKNSPLWKSDPDQQQCYYTGRSWARRYTPEVILGVYDRDELMEDPRGPESARDVTPKQSLSDRLALAREASQEPAGEQEGFNAAHVARETSEALTGEIIEPQNAGEDIPAPPVDDAASATAASEGGTDNPSTVSPSTNPWLLNIARMLWAATNYNGDVSVLKAQKQAAVASYPKPDDCPVIISGKAESVYAYCKQITEGSLEPDDGLAIIAGVVGCDQDDLKTKGA